LPAAKFYQLSAKELDPGQGAGSWVVASWEGAEELGSWGRIPRRELGT